jgi:hypothetical protein
MCKTLEIEHKGVKLVGARGMAVRVHAEKAVSGEEEQEWQVLMESVGHKSGRLRGRNLRENIETCRFSGARTGHKTWRKSGKCRIPGASQKTKMNLLMMMMMTTMMMVMVVVVMMMMMLTMTTETMTTETMRM